MLAPFDDVQVVAEAASGPEAVTVAPRVRPDVILMDLRMPGGDGVGAIRELAPEYRVVVLTTFSEDGDLHRALDAGAVGYLLKDVSAAVLADGIRAAARGRRTVSPDLVPRLSVVQKESELSEREREVLALVSDGLTNGEIGARLFIGEATVKTYLARVFGKLGVTDRTAAVVAAMERGLLR